jgi:hypothetical protein
MFTGENVLSYRIILLILEGHLRKIRMVFRYNSIHIQVVVKPPAGTYIAVLGIERLTILSHYALLSLVCSLPSEFSTIIQYTFLNFRMCAIRFVVQIILYFTIV